MLTDPDPLGQALRQDRTEKVCLCSVMYGQKCKGWGWDHVKHCHLIEHPVVLKIFAVCLVWSDFWLLSNCNLIGTVLELTL